MVSREVQDLKKAAQVYTAAVWTDQNDPTNAAVLREAEVKLVTICEAVTQVPDAAEIFKSAQKEFASAGGGDGKARGSRKPALGIIGKYLERCLAVAVLN
jgi:hypothetical protein